MGRKAAEIAGQRFTRLLAIERVGRTPNGQAAWRCICDCGNEITATAGNLVSGNTKSCGCWKHDVAVSNKYGVTHGLSMLSDGSKVNPLYHVWKGMHRRCYSENDEKYPIYGARGIRVCERWHSLENFLEDMSPRPEGTTLDRKDVNGDYSPDNCRWATAKQQANNTRTNRQVTLRGETHTLMEWAEKLGMGWATLRARLEAGWGEDRILDTPVRS